MFDWFRGRGNAETGPRDGEAPVLEQLALSEPDGAVAAPAPVAAGVSLTPHELQRDMLLGSLSQKVLNVHLANRFQISYPLVLNLQSLQPGSGVLLMEVAAAALLCDPRTVSRAEAARADLAETQADASLLAAFDRAIAQPRALNFILPEIAAAGLEAHAYAVSLIALGRPTATGRHHLAYLAARLGLGEEIVGSLKRRYQR